MSDHFSGPAVIGDPAVDITDFYAFVSPQRPGNLVLIMDTFPLATPGSFFTDAVSYRFRLRPLTRSGRTVTHGEAEYTVDVHFNAVTEGTSAQSGHVVTSDGRETKLVVGEASEHDGMRVFAGLVSDPFFMDVIASIVTTDVAGKLSFKKEGENTVYLRDVLSMVVELPIAQIVERFGGITLVGAVSETIARGAAKPIRIERVGRPEIKNFLLTGTIPREPRTNNIDLRDLYNREDAFALSPQYRSLYESRINANLKFFDDLDGKVDWPLEADGKHPLRDLLVDDYLILDLARPFVPGSFLEIERAMLDGRPHESSGGRWLADDILDDMLTLYVNAGRGERFGDGVHAPTKPPSLEYPYVREPNLRADLPPPSFLEN